VYIHILLFSSKNEPIIAQTSDKSNNLESQRDLPSNGETPKPGKRIRKGIQDQKVKNTLRPIKNL
jgi:hypothetical protein